MNEPRILEVRTKILKKNDETAREMRSGFVDADVLVSNFVSSPGTGKTTLLQKTLLSSFAPMVSIFLWMPVRSWEGLAHSFAVYSHMELFKSYLVASPFLEPPTACLLALITIRNPHSS